MIDDCERDAIDDTRACLGQLQSIRNGYADGLHKSLNSLRTEGYDPRALHGVDADTAAEPSPQQRGQLTDIRQVTNQAVVDQMGKVRAAQQALDKGLADLYTHGPGSPEGEAAAASLPKLKADLAHALDDLGKLPDYNSIDPASVSTTPDGHFTLSYTVDGQPVQVTEQLKDGAGEFYDQATGTDYTFRDGKLTGMRTLDAGKVEATPEPLWSAITLALGHPSSRPVAPPPGRASKRFSVVKPWGASPRTMSCPKRFPGQRCAHRWPSRDFSRARLRLRSADSLSRASTPAHRPWLSTCRPPRKSPPPGRTSRARRTRQSAASAARTTTAAAAGPSVVSHLRYDGAWWVIDTVNDRGQRHNDTAKFSTFDLAEKYLIWDWASMARGIIGVERLGPRLYAQGYSQSVTVIPVAQGISELRANTGNAILMEPYATIFSHIMSTSTDEIERTVADGVS